MAVQQLSLGGASSGITPLDLTSAIAQTATTSGGSATGLTQLTPQLYQSLTQGTPNPNTTGDVTTDYSISPIKGFPGEFSVGTTGDILTESGNPNYSPQRNLSLQTPLSTDPNATLALSGSGRNKELAVTGDTGTSSYVTIDPYTGDPNAIGGAGDSTFGSHQYDYSVDPFLFTGMAQEKAQYAANTGVNAANETQSPGYKQFGQTWLDLLNTIGSQDLNWGGTNADGPLKGGGSVTSWDANNLVSPWNSGNQEKAYANAVDFISKQTGLDPNSQQAKQLGGAYLEYTLQNQNLYDLNSGVHASRDNSDKGILGDVELGAEVVANIATTIFAPYAEPFVAAGTAALNAGQDLAEGNYLGAGLAGLSAIAGGVGGAAGLADEAASEASDVVSTATALDESSNLSNISSALGAAAAAGNLGQSISTGNPLGILGGAAGLISPAANLVNSGTSGSNSTSSGSGITSDISQTLGIPEQELTQYINYASEGIPLAAGAAGTAVPLIEKALSGSSNVNLPQPGPPPAPPPTPVLPAETSGPALAPQSIYNPAQANYQANTTPSNEKLAQLLLSLGVA